MEKDKIKENRNLIEIKNNKDENEKIDLVLMKNNNFSFELDVMT